MIPSDERVARVISDRVAYFSVFGPPRDEQHAAGRLAMCTKVVEEHATAIRAHGVDWARQEVAKKRAAFENDVRANGIFGSMKHLEDEIRIYDALIAPDPQ